MRATYYNKDKRKYADMNYESKYLLDPKYMTKRDLQHYYRYYSMAKGEKQFKKIILIIFCICFFAYIFVDYNLRTKIIRLRDRFDFMARVDAEYNITQAYFVDTSGCRMPYFNVTDNNIIQFMLKPENFICNKPLTRTSDVGASLWLNMNESEMLQLYNISDLESISCFYQELRRKNDKLNEYMTHVPFQLELNKSLEIKEGIEFIRVDCYDAELKNIYKDFHFFALDKTESSKEPGTSLKTTTKSASTTAAPFGSKMTFESVSFSEDTNHSRKKSNSFHSSQKTPSGDSEATDEHVSVMVLGIDSVSHLNFLRQMQHTAAYIHQNLTHVEFWGFNKVGDNTYPNLVPMLTGLEDEELNISCLAPVKQAFYDKCPFIWKRYKDNGYKTVYAEDVGSLGLFNYFRAGFKSQPTDYYLRPIMCEMERHISYKLNVNVELCKGGRRTVDVVLELIRKLIPHMRVQDFFSFFWTVTITHDLLNMPRLLDEDFIQLFKQFEISGIFNKTVIFLMSDHGIRWGSFRKTYQGMMEERQPLLIALYPKWFKQKYPEAIANLELNSKRLTTFYDLHATMLSLLDLRNLRAKSLEKHWNEMGESDTMPRGISLFLPIPETRTCETAGIASHWCTCHQRQELLTNDYRVQRAARYIVKLINERLKPHPQCRVLYLNSIMEAIIAGPHHKIVKDITNDYGIDITLRIQTKPGLGVFESTVRMSSYSTALTGTISRINLYGSQSYCINDYALKLFCYCHR